jgi:glycosyltransferase involved in cell wall biosynthesis
VLGDAELHERLGRAARQRYEREFTAALMTQRMLDLYRGLLART